VVLGDVLRFARFDTSFCCKPRAYFRRRLVTPDPYDPLRAGHIRQTHDAIPK